MALVKTSQKAKPCLNTSYEGRAEDRTWDPWVQGTWFIHYTTAALKQFRDVNCDYNVVIYRNLT